MPVRKVQRRNNLMIRRTITALMLVLMSFGVLVAVPQSQARQTTPHKPAIYDCLIHDTCYSNLTWFGDVTGAQTTVALSDPTVGSGYGHIRLRLDDTEAGSDNNSADADIEVGYEIVGTNQTDHC